MVRLANYVSNSDSLLETGGSEMNAIIDKIIEAWDDAPEKSHRYLAMVWPELHQAIILLKLERMKNEKTSK